MSARRFYQMRSPKKQVKIEGYSFGRMKVGGNTFEKDLILYPDKIEPNWWREQGHALSANDLRTVFQFKPDILVVGQGAFGRLRIPPETGSELKKRNIELISGTTDDMCPMFNRYVQNGKRVAGAFHLTC
ncbi:MAG: hypothetical protein GF333_00840 [Candidatus Omnitrophica bacterium]|nr:hypothetical protein [Candidatus Omnitrophota bacterium]